MALLALGPFLHAHYGNSHSTGFHVDGISQALFQTDSHFSAFLPAATSSSEEESAALGVTASHTRQTIEATDASPDKGNFGLAWLVLVGALFAAWQSFQRRVRDGDGPVRARRRVFAPGLPTLAHAPPSLFI